MVYYLTDTEGGNVTLPNVRNERSAKDAQLFQMPLPLSNSNESIVLDIFGVNRTISLDGTYVPGITNEWSSSVFPSWGIPNATFNAYTADQKIAANIAGFIYWLDKLVNGNQNTRIYHSDTSGLVGIIFYSGDYTITILTVEWKRSEGEVNKVDYSISMMECAPV